MVTTRARPVTASPPLRRLGFFLARRHRLVLALALALLAGAGVLAAGAASGLSLSRFEAPGSESDRAQRELVERFGTGSPDMIFLVTARRGTVDDPAVEAAGRELTERAGRHEGVAESASYWTRGKPATLRSRDGRHALIVVRIPGDADHVRAEVLPRLVPEITRGSDLLQVRAGGGEEVFRETVPLARQDFVRAELVIFPLAFVLLWLYQRRVMAALVPILAGVYAMVLGLALLGGVLLFADISTFALNLTLAMGLGLGIDYCLFVIQRFREETRRGVDRAAAVAGAVEHAGRTVLFSGLTVASSLAVLFALPFDFLRSFAYAGIAVVAGGLVAAVIVLPAVLAAIGGAFLPRRPVPERADGFWHGLATRVMRRPLVFGGLATALLLVLASPFLGLRFGVADDRILPPEASSRQTQDVIRRSFPAEETDAIQLVSKGAVAGDVAPYAASLSRLPGVAQVDSAAGSYAGGTRVGDGEPARFEGPGTWLSVVPSAAALADDPVRLVEAVRAVPPPFEVLVGGYPAELADYRSSVVDRLPLLLALMLAVTFAVLFLMTRSVVIPIKATLLNVLSLGVMFGAIVWIFQDGHLSGLLGFTPTGTLDPSIPILMLCVAYGLSMDYEVFLLSRIKEEYDRTGDTESAVATGLQAGAPLITAAGGILALSFAAYATASVAFVQMLGVGMAVAVLVDATVIRAVLVPSLMRLAGPLNWWPRARPR
ncbi:Integral membrane protein [[Actinomadura] parvosata subsp. kistnae]|uniref:RND transporter n=1 Tax=[Actinomadura] parvosata subsp. kistnae TaxID=1909395 RepID=A0A1V0A3W4_9ACTN|nr:MMPL family transporter [Nonomuraea sp. ATCC 55076]AQZ64900.1 RND transporter [Nonomuraea sp. ATCC 55076]SPL96123.1 Integral membrane protein [Actinomadura parvosata subsp. kistnae]